MNKHFIGKHGGDTRAVSLNYRNVAALGLTILSLGVLIPGLILPALTVDISMEIFILGKKTLFHETNSISSTIETLFRNGHLLIACLILVFSVVVPVVKAMVLISVLVVKSNRHSDLLYKVIRAIGKWSMADVFVVAIFMAFLAISANENVHASLHTGFYFFLAYCIISLVGVQLMEYE